MPHLENASTALEMSLGPSQVLVFRETAQDLSRQKGQRPSRVLVRTKTCVAEATKMQALTWIPRWKIRVLNTEAWRKRTLTRQRFSQHT